ncbi:MAG: bifunctional phosphopantothenoylcysteine decarboxylase/phosphopantothenate--cysteine ligase CoaBC [Actinobacteria bacterium]|nr:bifunctional phosphopantothenoylcysteine decarboxylase/phosphopantothenate--cysteine ligase CoaBC [Actinomycetota bacterium]
MTGGIAAYKACILTRLLTEAGAEVQVVMTASATRFVGPDTFAALSGRPVRSDVFEDVEHVLHVRMAHDADVAVVAPATANVLAKLSVGIADDLLTSTLLEARCPVVVVPEMLTWMYEDPATQASVRTLAERGVEIVGPKRGHLAAGDEGMGRMAEPEEIVGAVAAVLGRGRDLAGRRILVTAGPTWEPIDPVRFVGNRSSGKMGFAVAVEARARGALVTVVAGPTSEPDPPGIDVVHVTTAHQMREEVLARAGDADAVVKAAAVSDFRPEEAAGEKLKKEHGPPEIRLVPTRDILRELGASRREGTVLVGFAAETADLEGAARRKLEGKNLDMIVVNEVGKPGTGFGSLTNRALIHTRTGDDEPLRMWTKAELARAICDRLAKLLPLG